MPQSRLNCVCLNQDSIVFLHITNVHLKVSHLKRLKLSCLKDDTAKLAGEMLLQIASSSAGFAGV